MPLNYSLLIVEDNEDLLEDYTGWFIRCGYDVTAVHHPRQAIEAVTFNKFRVAVMDCNLPDISGIELMQQLKRLTDIEVIIVSGHNAAEREAIECGAYAYLVRPWRLSDLADTIENAIEQHKAPSQPNSVRFRASSDRKTFDRRPHP